MTKRRKPKVKTGRRTDIPASVIKQFKGDIQGIQNALNTHLTDHSKMVETLVNINENIKKSNDFMENLSWLNDISRGTKLLKSPILWFLAFIVGTVALLGGVKALAASFFTWVMPR